jgi:hypothetical protein
MEAWRLQANQKFSTKMAEEFLQIELFRRALIKNYFHKKEEGR